MAEPTTAADLIGATYHVNENGLVVLSVTEPQYIQAIADLRTRLQAAAEMADDMRMLKNNIFRLLIELNILNSDGSQNKKWRPSKLMSLLGTILDPRSAEEKFGWLASLVPLVEKYKNL